MTSLPGSPYRFRPLTPADLPMIALRLRTPEVLRWWGEPEEQLALVAGDLGEPRMRQWIVEYRGRAFAYAQAYPINAWPQPHLVGLHAGTVAVDTFIGVPEMIGRGHGGAFLRMLAELLIAEGATAVAVDPDVANGRARDAYARAGFVAQGERKTAGGLVVVMLFRRDASQGGVLKEAAKGVRMPDAHPANIDIDAALHEAEERYATGNPKSLAQYEAACAALPGGNTRSAIYAEPFPLTMVKGEGAHLWDADGHEYADFLSEFTAGLYGHSHPAIRKAIDAALDGGINFGAHGVAEAKFAAAICDRFPSVELVRFTNSGTEANLMAVSAAIGITGKRKILVFHGGYHGGVFYFRGKGSPINAPFDYLMGTYNDIEAVRALVAPHRGDLAAILIEPMLGGSGCIPATREFLADLRALASETGAILIFDEVMTSRLAPGGLQELHGIRPDMTTLGKYVGGGMSFGAFGGRSDLMEWFDPRNKQGFQHAGTFNNNVLTMNAGLAGLTEVYTPAAAKKLNDWGDGLRERLNAVASKKGLAMQFTGIGSMIAVHMRGGAIENAADAAKGHAGLLELFYFDLTARGIWFAKRGMMALSIVLDDADADHLVGAVEDFAETRAPLFAGL